jgi:hypothetical protein
VHRFDIAEVLSYKVTVRRRQRSESTGAVTGDVAADVFSMFDDGVHPVDVVKRLRLPPDVVVALSEQWARMREAFIVGADDARELARIAASRRRPTTADEVISAFRDRVEALRSTPVASHAGCAECGDGAVCICASCFVGARGPLATSEVRLEHRTDESGTEQVRVAALACWSSALDEGCSLAPLRSEWFRRDGVERTSIGEIVAGIARRGVAPAGAG